MNDDILARPDNPIPHLDGNVAAGVLMELFGTDISSALGRCENCAAVRVLADTVVYVDAPGLVIRCRSCSAVLMRVVECPDRYWVDLSGLSNLQIEKPAPTG